MVRRVYGKSNMIALCLLLAMLLQLLTVPTSAAEQDGTAYPVQSEEYRAQFSADLWEADGGVLKMNNTQGIDFYMEQRNAALYASLVAYEGKTKNNALQLVIENRSSCTELLLEYVWHGADGEEHSGSCSLQIAPQSEKTVYYAYIDEVDEIEQLRIECKDVKSGQLSVYRIARASYYRQLAQTHGSITACTYDPTLQTVTVQGTVRTDSVVDFSGGSILLYRLLPFETLQQMLERNPLPLHTNNMSNRFTFTVDAPVFLEANARYAVALKDKYGNTVPMAEPTVAIHRAASSYAGNGAAALPDFKGVYAEDSAVAQRVYAGTAMVDVYLNRLFAAEDSSVEAYEFDGAYYSFDRQYIDALLKQTEPLLAIGMKLTLRLLIEPDARGYALPFTVDASDTTVDGQYLGILLQTAEAQRAYGAALSYLFAKYGEVGDALPTGIVPGMGLDTTTSFDVGTQSLRDYLLNTALLLALTKNAVAAYSPETRVYLSLTDTPQGEAQGICSSETLLEGVCRMLEDLGCGDDFFALMLENHRAPFGLNADILQNGIEGVQAAMYYEQSTGATKNIPTVESLLSGVAGYECVANTGTVVWTPPADCTGLALSLSYAYLYHLYFGNRAVDGFTVHITQDSDAETVLATLIAGIDTNAAAEVTAFALPYFGLSKWSVLSGKTTQSRTVYECTLEELDRQTYAGSYEYWNFTSALGTLGWNAGFDCESLSMDGGSRFGRVLLAEMSGRGCGALTYSFAVPEKFSVCDAVSATLAVTDKNGNPVDAKVSVTLFGDNFRMVGSAVVRSGEMETLAMTGRMLKNTGACHSVLITVEPISTQVETVRLYMMQIEGWSKDQDADALRESILASRESVDADAGGTKDEQRFVPLLAFAALLLTTAGFFAIMRIRKKGSERLP